jgi:lipid II:glycine glycyltransferase (peptidoglycan interpeptide bridge formation enzyme)
MKILINTLAVCKDAGNFLQSDFWGRFKTKFGWKTYSFSLEFESGEKMPLLVLYKTVLRIFNFAYVPWGPLFPPSVSCGNYKETLVELSQKLQKELPPDCAFIRYDLPIIIEKDIPIQLGAPFSQAKNVQCPHTVILDLRKSTDEILSQMKSKWRYNIRLGNKKVAVKKCGHERLDEFYLLLKETAKRDKISLHSHSYYETLLSDSDESNDVRLYLAEHEGATIAGIVTLFRKKEAVYLYGASSSQHRNLMAPYALQWQAILDAKEAGCETYDFFGIAPDDNPRHPMHGLYFFKTGFGGSIVHRPGCVDFSYKPLAALLFRILEKLR